MGMLYQLEEQAEKTVTQEIQDTLQDALMLYKPMCKACDLAMARHHNYRRTLITKYGAVNLAMPVFRCGKCGDMQSGMELVGDVERRKSYSKKRVERR